MSTIHRLASGTITTAQITHLQAQIAVYCDLVRGIPPDTKLLECSTSGTENSVLPVTAPISQDVAEPWMACIHSIQSLPNNNGSAIRVKIREAINLAENNPEVVALLGLAIATRVYRGNNGGGTKAVALQALEIFKLKKVWRKQFSQNFQEFVRKINELKKSVNHL